MSLEKETKAYIGFIERMGTCGTCQHHRLADDAVKGKLFNDVCGVSNLCTFEVDPDKNSCGRYSVKARLEG